MTERLALPGFFAVAVLGIMAFHAGNYPPIALSVAGFGAVAFYLTAFWRANKIGFLVLWFFVCYALPFIHLIPYLWFDFEGAVPQLMWGLAVNPYMIDQTVIELMALLGALGAIGFLLGAVVGNKKRRSIAHLDLGGETTVRRAGLSLVPFLLLTGCAVFLSWLYAPSQTLFEARYTEGVAISQDWNFGSIWMISYVVLVWCLADALCDTDRKRARKKKAVLFAALLVVVGWLQLLRGDRESIPLLLASVFMSVRWQRRVGRPGEAMVWTFNRLVLVGVSGVLIVVLSYLIGALRSEMGGLDWKSALVLVSEMWASGMLTADSFLHGTWSAVLLTPLSAAGDYLAGSLPLKLGQDYLNYLLSLPPGFVADLLGYQRPIDAWRGPAWEMTYGIGGTHAVVVPFMNFRAIGVTLVLMAWGYVVARCERKIAASDTVSSAALWGTLVMVAPHWFWYGDKYFINAMIIWWGVSLAYRLAVATPQSVGLALGSGASFAR